MATANYRQGAVLTAILVTSVVLSKSHANKEPDCVYVSSYPQGLESVDPRDSSQTNDLAHGLKAGCRVAQYEMSAKRNQGKPHWDPRVYQNLLGTGGADVPARGR